MFDSSRKVLELEPSCEIGNVAFTKYPIADEAGAAPREKVLYLPGIEFLGISYAAAPTLGKPRGDGRPG
jgi:hypothetical protein